jgi:hypothetical protein
VISGYQSTDATECADRTARSVAPVALTTCPLWPRHRVVLPSFRYDDDMRRLVASGHACVGRRGRALAIAADIAGDGDTALELLSINAYEIAESIVAAGSGMPILMLTAADRLVDKASGYRLVTSGRGGAHVRYASAWRVNIATAARLTQNRPRRIRLPIRASRTPSGGRYRAPSPSR